jgi:hypothetical protein
VAAAVASLAVTLACDSPPAVNPWADDSVPARCCETPSYQGVMKAGHEPTVRHRDVSPVEAPLVDGQVPHYPLYWEDPFEDKGDQNDTYAWTWQDYVVMPYGLGRFILNTIAWPVSAVVTPPGTPMVSDGVIGRDHDARRGESPDPTDDLCPDHLSGADSAAEPAGPPDSETQPAPQT